MNTKQDLATIARVIEQLRNEPRTNHIPRFANIRDPKPEPFNPYSYLLPVFACVAVIAAVIWAFDSAVTAIAISHVGF